MVLVIYMMDGLGFVELVKSVGLQRVLSVSMLIKRQEMSEVPFTAD